nr:MULTISPECIES: RHS repeat-associated core domain-containing protein [Pseudomonas syringae group]
MRRLQYFDAETGLHYNRHRYYNPGTGRFLTPNPIKLAGGLNNFRYVPNPTGCVDSLGLSGEPCDGPDKKKSNQSRKMDYENFPRLDLLKRRPSP